MRSRERGSATVPATASGLAVGAAALVLLLASGCSRERSVVIGSKKFTESVILGEIATQLLQRRGIAAEHRDQLGGTRILWSALLAGEVDAYPDYTGTLCEEVLHLDCEHAPLVGVMDVLTGALARQGVGSTGPLGFRDQYALAMRAELAERLGVRTIADLARHPELHLGFSEEFMARADGWPALKARYGLTPTDVRGIDHDLAWRGLATGSIDVLDAYTTDAEIRQIQPRLLDDNLRFFKNYEALVVYREALGPGPRRVLAELAGRIREDEMIAMNARARLDKVPEAQIAADWLAAHPEVAGADARPGADPTTATTATTATSTRRTSEGGGMLARVGRRTGEHLVLVGVSLAGAILLGVPLGIAASRRRRLGQLILGATGLAQTVPSLALLVFMIPLLGIGAAPALVALLLYSLLPIVRSTLSGLEGIAAPLRESAAVIGLSPWQQLRLVELPLAMPAILAGIQTAAVIDVGTATLGALIGAGGYGQPILTGIRLDDTRLILEGAVPAAVLALAVQWLFDLLAPRLVSRGLRLHTAASD